MYDFNYFEYLMQVIMKAQDYDLKMSIDPHQDVWSRFTGGSGAPKWTLRRLE